MAEADRSDLGARVLGESARRRVLDQIEVWRKELINLARSNRLLYFRHTRSSTLEIIREPDQVSEVVDRLLSGATWRFYYPPDPDGVSADTNAGDALFADDVAKVPAADELITSKTEARTLRNALRLLDRRATQEFMDKGLWILYLAAGMLHWSDPDTHEEAESPLVLIPVELYRENPRVPYELRRAEDDMVVNPALAVKLAEFGVELPAIDEDVDVDAVLAQVESAVEDRPGWQVRRRLVISPFSFHKEVMFRDLLKNQEEIAEHPLAQALALGAEEGSELDFEPIHEEELDERAPPEDVATILDADATQRQCIAAAAGGASFVMDGPPGTGKSQTIANMIAELLAKGKTVLFVSEKAAALEVVQKRLRAAGLDDYTLELHSHKATRKEVAQHLGASLEFHPAASAPMAETARAKLVRRRKELSQRAQAMNEIRFPLGRSLHQAIGRIAQLQHLPQAPPPEDLGAELSAEHLSSAQAAASEMARAWGPVARGNDFLWRDLSDVRLDAARQQRTAEEVQLAMAHLERVRQLVEDAAGALMLTVPRDFAGAELLLRVLCHLRQRQDVSSDWLTRESLDEVASTLSKRRDRADAHTASAQTALDLVGKRWREVPSDAASRLQDGEARLKNFPPRFSVGDDFAVAGLRRLEQFVDSTTTTLEAILADARSIAISFGMPTDGITLTRAAELAELALLAGDSARPEPEWVNPAGTVAVQQAVSTLQPLCVAVETRRAKLTEIFTDEVVTLDLDSLSLRFATVHTGLGKIKPAYREDKKLIAGATRAGKPTKAAIALLPQALEWKRLAHELDLAERTHAKTLGGYYYQRTDTNFDSIAHALRNTGRALEIAGRHLNATAMCRQLARGGDPDAELVPTARRLTATIETWREPASAILGPFADQLEGVELELAILWARGAAGALATIGGVASGVDQIAERPLSFGDVCCAAEQRRSVDAIESELAETDEADRLLLGSGYAGLTTDWDRLTAAVGWANGLRALLGSSVSAATAQQLQTSDLDPGELDGVLSEWQRARDHVLASFTDARRNELRADLKTTFEDAAALLDALASSVGDIEEWVEYQRARAELAELSLEDVIAFCEASRLDATDVPAVVERACLEGWADAVIEHDSIRLRQFRADQLDPIAEEFRRLDLDLIEHAASRVVAVCNGHRPRTTIGAAGIIKREAEKQRRHMPVRKLLEEAGEIAQALKPCFMMSPLTVSQFLPSSLKFDVVVFDEASQVRPSDAINCVYRGNQLIVAGDDKQLPPTSFFEAVSMDGDDEWQEEQFDEFESILQLCKGSGGLRELPLRWHYRSQHEDLISYSNQSFYDGRLITFPGAVHAADDLGVAFYHVADGVYRRGTARDNPREAEAVVDRVMHWARMSLNDADRDYTVGVVAFSEAQATAIEVALEKRRQTAPEVDMFFAEDRLDGFFVKNLENVQGDERDVMIFSVGYGRDENGKLTMNFGPLNRDGGQRRLNVAITRARRRVEVVASITSTEAEFSGDIRQGARHLQRYLDYAERGPVALALDIGASKLDAESPFEEEVIRAIRSWGYDVQPQVGTAGYRVDIGVKHPDKSGRFALGVECDGWMYHSSKVARDRDRLRQEVLERLGWRIYRIWGTAWYRNRPEQEERLRGTIDDAINGDADHRPARTPTSRTPRWDDNAGFEAAPLDEVPAWTTPYRIASPKRPAYRGLEMHVPEAQADLRRMILEVVRLEGPIRDELLLRRVREAWGVGRAGHRIRQNFDSAVAALVRTHKLARTDNVFLTVPGSEVIEVRAPGRDPEARRTVDEVPPSELKLAVRHLVQDARRVSRDELTFEVARLFGWNRRGTDITAALENAVDALIRDGAIGEDGDHIKLT